MKKTYPLLAIGNAIVDIFANKNDEFLASENISKGAMNLINKTRAKYLYKKMQGAQKIAGGSAANSAVAFSRLANNMAAAYFGKIGNDELGKLFTRNMKQAGVKFSVNEKHKLPTARSAIFITPDSERSMNTYLGAAFHLGKTDICPQAVSQAKIIYFEGYIFDSPKTKKMFYEIIKQVKGTNKKIAQKKVSTKKISIGLADSFCVERHRKIFMELLKEKIIDIIFCNEQELLALFKEKSFSKAVAKAKQTKILFAITRGKKGSMAICGKTQAKTKAEPIKKIINTTGAGDCYTAGFLFTMLKNKSLEKCIKQASKAAKASLKYQGAVPKKFNI